MTPHPVVVVGVDGSPLPLVEADLVVGAARHLARLGEPRARTVVLGALDPAVAEVRKAVDAGERVVVLASGDPGFLGIVRRLRAEGLDVDVRPGVSSVAVAFARVGVEWDDAQVVSAHGREPGRALAVVRTGRKTAVLTDAVTGPREVALAAPEGATLVVAERLGEHDERVVVTTRAGALAGEWREPNVVLVLDDAPPAPAPSLVGGWPVPGRWALPEDAFSHRDGMVTKAEVRALVLARLAPAPGVQVWDVGAGSGSVAVECARLGAAAVAVERGDVQHVLANAAVHGVRVDVVQGTAPEALRGLPQPDAVFVGGGGPAVVDAVAAARPDRVVVALATLERVGPTRDALVGYDVDVVLLQAQRLEPLGEGHRLVPANPVFVVSGVRR